LFLLCNSTRTQLFGSCSLLSLVSVASKPTWLPVLVRGTTAALCPLVSDIKIGMCENGNTNNQYVRVVPLDPRRGIPAPPVHISRWRFLGRTRARLDHCAASLRSLSRKGNELKCLCGPELALSAPSQVDETTLHGLGRPWAQGCGCKAFPAALSPGKADQPAGIIVSDQGPQSGVRQRSSISPHTLLGRWQCRCRFEVARLARKSRRQFVRISMMLDYT